MKILAIETSTEACSVALLDKDKCNEFHEIVPQKHTERLLPMLDELLTECKTDISEINYIAFGCGPGAFTGIRIACSAAQAISFSQDIPIIPISTLAGLAHGAAKKYNSSKIIACIDARMQEVYWANYSFEANSGKVTLAGEEQVISPEATNISFNKGNNEIIAIGSGWLTYKELLTERHSKYKIIQSEIEYPHAKDIAEIAKIKIADGNVKQAEDALPTYLRNKVTHQKRG